MIDKMNHYAFTNPPTVYDEEALTALELAARMGGKVNECVETINNFGKEFDEIVDGYMDDLREEIESGDFASLAITNGSVDASKLANHIMPLDVHITAAVYNTPLLFIDLAAHTVSVNTEISEPCTIYTRGKSYTFTPQELTANITDYLETGSEAFSLFYDPETKTIFVASFDDADTNNLKKFLFLGRLNANRLVNTLKIPVEVNGEFVGVSSGVIPDYVKPVSINMNRFKTLDNVVFDFTYFANEPSFTIINGGKYNLYVGTKAVEIDFDTVTPVIDFTATLMGANNIAHLIFDPIANELILTSGIANVKPDVVYLGFCNFSEPDKSNCIIPFSSNKRLIYHPKKPRRELATLYCEYANANYGRTIPYIEFDWVDEEAKYHREARLVFPSVRAIYVISPDGYKLIHGESGGVPHDYIVTLGSGLQYVVAGENGIKSLSAKEFASGSAHVYERVADTLYYFGTVNYGIRSINLTFECIAGGTVVVLGDSISTNEGDIPDGHPTYYNTDRQNCWWDKACRGAGLRLLKNMSYSGLLVTDTRDSTYCGKALANNLHMTINLDNGSYANCYPDNIIIYLGINDYQLNVAVDDASKGWSISMESKFANDYLTMIWNAQKSCPKAKIFLCTLPPAKCFGKGAGNLDSNGSGKFITQYNWVIMRLAELTGCEVIRLDECGFNLHNGALYMHDYNESNGDFLHPNSRGHSLIANQVIKHMYHGAKRSNDMQAFDNDDTISSVE